MRGSIVKKPNGRLYVVYYVAKKQKWEKVPENKRGVQTKKNAERLLALRIAEVNSGTYRDIKDIGFREFAKRWLRDYVDDPNHIKHSTASRYQIAFKTHLLPYFGDYGLSGITPDIVQGFVTKLSKSGLSANTIKNNLVPLTTMLKHAVQWGYLRSSPMPYVQRPKIPDKEMAFLTADELRRFLGTIQGEWRTFFLPAALVGMRIGEVVAMRWKNLDWDKSRYQVQERLYEGRFDTPKTRKSRRSVVDLTPTVIEALRSHRSAQSELKLRQGDAYQDHDLVFCRANGKPFTHVETHRNMFNSCLKEAECPHIRIHDLRHTYASLLIAQGESPIYIQQQLGHSSIKVTYDLYGHLMPEIHKEAPARLDRQVFGTD